MNDFKKVGLLVAFLMCGCGQEQQIGYDITPGSTQSMLVESPAEQDAGSADFDAMTLVSETTGVAKLQRRIVYNSELKLVVEQYDAFEKSIVGIVDAHDGFISSSETDRRYASRQSGTWVARIPVERYSEFLTAITELGFAESRSENAQDVTAEYVDVEARIRNNQQLEQRILEMLEERTGKLADVLEIERELARVRDEIERMQGRMRVLTDQSSLATITIQVREEQEYVPKTAPTLSSRLGSTWASSLEILRRAGEGLLLVGVALVPWLVTIGTLATIAYFALIRPIVRRFRRRV